ncbi:MAG: PEGA domain-containing protein [Pseudomonadota bacterium]
MTGLVLFLFASRPAAASSGVLWMDEPLAIGADVDPAQLRILGNAVEQQIQVATGRAPGRGDRAPSAAVETDRGGSRQLLRARELLQRGEDLYVAFDYGPAAAALAESAGLFASSLSELDAEDVQRLYQARVLEGLAWFDAGRPEAAKEAFAKLATIRPDYQPEAASMPPAAQGLYQQAVREVLAAGTGSLQVASEPRGAEALVDGVVRGRTPLTVEGLPLGTHRLTLVLPGYQRERAELDVTRRDPTVHKVQLTPLPMRLLLERVRQGAVRGQSAEELGPDLTDLLRETHSDALLILGVSATASGDRLLVTGRRWTAQGNSAAATIVDRSEIDLAARQLVPLLLAQTWPAKVTAGASPALDLDFERHLLGTGTGSEQASGESSWLLWGGLGAAGVVVTALTVAAVVGLTYLARPTETEPDRIEVWLKF